MLKDNVFAYDKKIYQRTTGSAMGLSFTSILTNIFMAEWQKQIVDEEVKTCEFCEWWIAKSLKQKYKLIICSLFL